LLIGQAAGFGWVNSRAGREQENWPGDHTQNQCPARKQRIELVKRMEFEGQQKILTRV